MKTNWNNRPVLVVDDDSDIRLSLEMMLQYEGFEVWTARNGKEALARLESEAAQDRQPAVILSDVKMPGMDGMELLERIVADPGAPPVVMISGHADVSMAVEAVRAGAADFIEKPLDENRLMVSLRNALRTKKLVQENTQLRRQVDERWLLVGVSPPIADLKEQVARVADSDAAVLITGENGTGKEVVARQIHLQSPRANGPFVAVNCAAIPGELIESELFGHEKGSFTGAHEKRLGHFEAADTGTLFLDEIGDMPLAAQAKVLRALETLEFTRVGGSKLLSTDIRVIAATNADLEEAVREKTFRLDLFYRLNVVPLRVPPLADRKQDVAVLAEHFLERIAQRQGRSPDQLHEDALALLQSLDFPGNVRQLKNLLEGASVFATQGLIQKEDVERVSGNLTPRATTVLAAGEEDPFQAETFEEFKERAEALFIQRRLEENKGNIKRTAETLGMQRSHLYKKLDRYGLR